jgi:subtilisin family serine protease
VSCNETPTTMAPVDNADSGDQALFKKDLSSSFTLADNYIVEFSGDGQQLRNAVASVGGNVENLYAQIGVASVSGIGAKEAAKLKKNSAVKSVTQDMNLQWVSPDMETYDLVEQESIGDDETFFGYQWNVQAISAPQAWDAGARGTGVRVAVIDGGISSNHPDIDDNIDVAASASFVPGFAFDEDYPGFRHATHVAGIIAAEDNSYGTIGIAPGATIIALKALHGGSGSFSWLIDAVMYAAGEADADVINMSLGAVFPRNNRDAAQLNAALGHAMNYAHQQGVTIVASAGNNGIDFDHAYMYVYMPAEAQHVIAVSATGPYGFGYGATDFDRPSSYTNYGQSLVEFAGPGGDFAHPGELWYFDMVLSPSFVSGSTVYWSFAAGTSMSAPAVAAVAALIIEANGGSMAPGDVKEKLKYTSDDLGKPGNDDYYGQGRVNAYRAVTE